MRANSRAPGSFWKAAALAEHPGRGIIASRYAAAYEREKRTNDLWNRASEAMRNANLSEARALLIEAGENTRCGVYRERIAAALARIARPETVEPSSPQAGATSQVAPSGRTRPVFQSLQEAQVKCKQMGFDLARRNPDGPGYICGLSGTPAQEPEEKVYYDYKEAKEACDRRNMLTVPHVELGQKSRGWVCFPKFPKGVLEDVPARN